MITPAESIEICKTRQFVRPTEHRLPIYDESRDIADQIEAYVDSVIRGKDWYDISFPYLEVCPFYSLITPSLHGIVKERYQKAGWRVESGRPGDFIFHSPLPALS